MVNNIMVPTGPFARSQVTSTARFTVGIPDTCIPSFDDSTDPTMEECKGSFLRDTISEIMALKFKVAPTILLSSFIQVSFKSGFSN